MTTPTTQPAPDRCTVCGSEGPMATNTPTCWKAKCIESYAEMMAQKEDDES